MAAGERVRGGGGEPAGGGDDQAQVTLELVVDALWGQENVPPLGTCPFSFGQACTAAAGPAQKGAPSPADQMVGSLDLILPWGAPGDWGGWFGGKEEEQEARQEQQGQQDTVVLDGLDDQQDLEIMQQELAHEAGYGGAGKMKDGTIIAAQAEKQGKTAEELAKNRAQSNGTDWGPAQPEGDKITTTDCEDWCHEPAGTAPR